MLEPLLALIIVILLIILFLLIKKVSSLKEQVNELLFRKSSQSVKYGKMTEQWIPFSDQFPFDSEKFRFLGNPIDGIVFDEDKIVFCEFKAGSSQLNAKQKEVKELVRKKKVDWLEFRIK